MQKKLVQVSGLTKRFGSQTAVNDMAFDVSPGEILAFLGPNGAGKTTTIKMVLGLITPDDGAVTVAGYDMTDPAQARAGRQHLGAVLEGSRNAYWRLSVKENLRYFGRLRGLSVGEIDERGRDLLELLELTEKADQEVRFLSRGMQQKVAIAIALIHQPQLLVLDEPTLGLDVEAAKTLEATISNFVETGGAVIITTHVMALAERLADRVFVIHQGQKVAYDETRTLLSRFNPQKTVEIKLESPLKADLAAKIADCYPEVVQHDNEPLLAWVEPEQSKIVALYELLDQAGQRVVSINQREPALEEVFLTLTRDNHTDAH